MKQRTRITILTLGIIMLALLLNTASYAKLVVLSATFNNDTAGFSPSTSSGCGANFSVAPSSNGLVVSSAAPTSCAGTFQIDKLVVLSSIPHPSFELNVTDTNNKLNMAASNVTLNGRPYNLAWDAHGNSRHGNANIAALNGQTTISVVVRFNAGTQTFVINNLTLSSN